jgi:hypothetical protein
MVRSILVGLLAVSVDALVVKKEPVMKLRGGLAGIDANQVANVVMGLSAANAGVMALAPKKAGEMYGVASTKWTDFFAQWAGIIMAGQTLSAFLSIVNGMPMAEALAWGFLPSIVFSIQDLLNDRMVGEMGMGDAAKYMPPLVNLLLTAALAGKIPGVDTDLAMKITVGWTGANGIFGYVATDKWMESWGGSGLTAVDKGMAKLMAQTMIGMAAYVGSAAFGGKSALESFGVMMGAYAAMSIDGSYISKTMEAMGVDPNKALFWTIIQLVTVGAIFF